jgi:uncharacterized protein YdiU (UPF0061 family)
MDDNIDKAIEKAKAAIQSFGNLFANKWLAMMRKKLGLTNELADDKKLADDLLIWMQTNKADYTNTFYHLSSDKLPDLALYQDEAFRLWHERWKQRQLENDLPLTEALSLMRGNNPVYIPRNHRVEASLQAATLGQDMSLVFELLDVVSEPYSYREELADYQEPPETEGGYKTFCGT